MAYTSGLSLSNSRIINLSHSIYPGIPLWSGDPPVEFETVAEYDRDGYFLRRFAMGEHSATHMNAPNSFLPDAVGIDAYTPENLVVPAVVIDVRPQVASDSNYLLGITDLHSWEKDYGEVPSGCVVLLQTGWHIRWQNPAAFLNFDDAGIPSFPGFAGETTQFLLKKREIAGVGIDTHGVDGGQDSTYTTNRLVLAKQGIVLECLNNLDQLPSVGVTLVIAPLPLKDGSGSPTTVFAFCLS